MNEMLVDSHESRGVVARLWRAKATLEELVMRHAPLTIIALARLNVANLEVEFTLLPRRRAA